MRNFILAALLAGVAARAVAAAGPDDDGGGQRHHAVGVTVRESGRTESRGEVQRSDRAAERPRRNIERIGASAGRPDVPRGDPVARSMEIRRGAIERAEAVAHRPVAEPAGVTSPEPQVERRQRHFEPRLVRAPGGGSEPTASPLSTRESVREWRGREAQRQVDPTNTQDRRLRRARTISIEERNVRNAPPISESTRGGLVQQKRSLPHVLDTHQRRVSRTPVFGTEPPAPRTSVSRAARPERHWNRDWRNDHRYDWRDWRRRHHSNFRLGFYYDPFGWDYFRYGIGWRMWPSYYSSSYWLNDPWQYRLPPAYGPYRWVRYHGDALLVNIYTGQVVDVVYNFFW
jgi:hypothetical protein